MEFIGSFISLDDLVNDANKEICFLARSNAGKSSLINALAKQKIAYISKKPGKTQTINLYTFDQNKRLVDLPGYGYAKVSREKIFLFNKLLEDYINFREQLVLVIQVCDVNVITDQDVAVAEQLHQKKINHIVVLNKIDRLSNQQLRQLQESQKKRFYTGCCLIYISCKQRQNIDKIYRIIKAI